MKPGNIRSCISIAVVRKGVNEPEANAYQGKKLDLEATNEYICHRIVPKCLAW